MAVSTPNPSPEKQTSSGIAASTSNNSIHIIRAIADLLREQQYGGYGNNQGGYGAGANPYDQGSNPYDQSAGNPYQQQQQSNPYSQQSTQSAGYGARPQQGGYGMLKFLVCAFIYNSDRG